MNKTNQRSWTRSITWLFIIALLLPMVATFAPVAQNVRADANDLFISEYIEGGSYNKAIEIYNGTGNTVDLSGYKLDLYSNANTDVTASMNLSGNLNNNDVFVAYHGSADQSIKDQGDVSDNSVINFNGNDSVVLKKTDGTVVDAIGKIAGNVVWGSGDTTTQNHTLVRKSTVCSGDTNPDDAFDPATEWDGYTQDTVSYLGAHTASCGGGDTTPPTLSTPVPLDPADGATDVLVGKTLTAQFNENIQKGSSGVIVIKKYTDDSTVASYAVSTSSEVTVSNDTLTINPASDFDNNTRYYVTIDAGAIEDTAGNDFAGIADKDTWDFTTAAENDTTAPTLSTPDPADDATDVSLNKTLTAQFSENIQKGSSGTIVIKKYADDSTMASYDVTTASEVSVSGDTLTINPAGDFDNNIRYYVTIDAGAIEDTSGNDFAGISDKDTWDFTTVALCSSGTVTKIGEVQGSGTASSKDGQTVTIRGVVTGDFQGNNELSGFFVQDSGDNDPATSDGIFVYDKNTDVSKGNEVQVTGEVDEYYTLTELKNVTSIEVCQASAMIEPTEVTMPFKDDADKERFEGMYITFPQTLTVTENYNLGRYGEIVLSAGGRLMNPTNVVTPGAEAQAYAAKNKLNRIVLDDGSTKQNPDPIIHPAGGLSASNTLRSGDVVSNVIGVVTYSYDEYRVHTTNTPTYTVANPRPAKPANITGTLRVASFNVLNYFNGDGNGGGFPTARGADSASEFTRQRDKIIAALVAMDADIIGLMEIENDGYDSTSAIQDLVNGLNDKAGGAGPYAFINPGVAKIGTDEIAVGLIYHAATVSPVGDAKILDSTVDATFIDTKNRPVLVQTFKQTSNDEKFTVAVNHLKSKGSDCDDLGDSDAGDGQGNCNQTRTNAAKALVNWLKTDPTGSDDSDFLIIGDLNAYAKEDPITTIKDAGYTDLIDTFIGSRHAYSYIYYGEAGYLDHALTSSSLTPFVTGVTEWHINTDEPSVLDYNEEYKSAGQVTSLYHSDQYRASDHDPVIIGLNLGLPEITVYDSTQATIEDGTITPYQFGTTTVGTPIQKRFTIANTGGMTLSLGKVSLPNGFKLIGDPLPVSLAPDKTTSLGVQLEAKSAGEFKGTLSLENNDRDENPFDFVIRGVVKDAETPEPTKTTTTTPEPTKTTTTTPEPTKTTTTTPEPTKTTTPEPTKTIIPVPTTTSPDLYVKKDVRQASYKPGKVVEYRITYGNDGGAAATNVTLTDTLPEGMTFVSANSAKTNSQSAKMVIEGNVIRWSVDSLEVGAHGTILLRGKIDATTKPGTTLVNKVEISTTSDEQDTSNNTASHTATVVASDQITNYDLAVQKIATGEAWAGGTLSYIIFYWNKSFQTAYDVVIEDKLPAGVTFTSVSHNGQHANGTVTWNIPAVGPHQFSVLRVVVQVGNNASGSAELINTVTIAGKGTDANPDNNSATVTTPIKSSPGSISGTVTDPDGTPSKRARVVLFRNVNDKWRRWRWTKTDTAGTYSFEKLPAGTYRIRFRAWKKRYPIEFYDDKDTKADATDIVVSSGAETSGIDAQFDNPTPPLATGSMKRGWMFNHPRTGKLHVRIFRNPRLRTDLTITHVPSCTTGVVSVTLRLTHNDGTFVDFPMQKVQPDSVYQSSKAFTATIPADSLEQGSLSVFVTCGNGQTQENEIGSVGLIDPSGIITDASTGQPIEGATVELFNLPDWTPRSSTTDDDESKCETTETKDPNVAWNDMEAAPTELGIPGDPDADPQEIDPATNPQTTNEDGWYGWNVVEGCWYVVVEADGYESRVSPAVGVPPEVTDLDLALTPLNTATVQFGSTIYTVNENTGTATVEVTVSGANGTVTVDYTTSDSGAKAGEDYTTTNGTLTFAAGETSKTISIPVTDDSVTEGNESLVLTLSNPTGAVTGSPAGAVLTIIDNENEEQAATNAEHIIYLPIVMAISETNNMP